MLREKRPWRLPVILGTILCRWDQPELDHLSEAIGFYRSGCLAHKVPWLVVEPFPSEKYEFVSWDNDNPN